MNRQQRTQQKMFQLGYDRGAPGNRMEKVQKSLKALDRDLHTDPFKKKGNASKSEDKKK